MLQILVLHSEWGFVMFSIVYVNGEQDKDLNFPKSPRDPVGNL